MDGTLSANDISRVVEADKAHVWHHLVQHKGFDSKDPNIIVEGKGMRVWNQAGKEHLDAVSGGVWTVNVGYGRERIAKAVYDQLMRVNYFAGAAGSVPGAPARRPSDSAHRAAPYPLQILMGCRAKPATRPRRASTPLGRTARSGGGPHGRD